MHEMSTATLNLFHLVRQPELPEPSGSTPDRTPPPLLILLHGLRSNEEDLFELRSYLDERFLILSLRAPLELGPDQYAWYHVNFRPEAIDRDAEDFERSRLLLAQFIVEAVPAYGADPRRVYLMGFSQGAIMSVATLLTRPELLAGAVIMSGALPDAVLPTGAVGENLQDLPVLVVHGVNDDVLPIADGRALRRHLAQLPVRLDYREYPMRHQISTESLDDVCGWLVDRLNQKGRTTQPDPHPREHPLPDAR